MLESRVSGGSRFEGHPGLRGFPGPWGDMTLHKGGSTPTSFINVLIFLCWPYKCKTSFLTNLYGLYFSQQLQTVNCFIVSRSLYIVHVLVNNIWILLFTCNNYCFIHLIFYIVSKSDIMTGRTGIDCYDFYCAFVLILFPSFFSGFLVAEMCPPEALYLIYFRCRWQCRRGSESDC